MIRYLAALVTATVAGVAGVWLVLAPAALGYPERRLYGSVAGRVDLATGCGLCAVALVTGAAWAIAWRRRLRADGVLPRRRPTRAAVEAVRAPVPPEDAPTQAIPVPAQAGPGEAAPVTARPFDAPAVPVASSSGPAAYTASAAYEQAGQAVEAGRAGQDAEDAGEAPGGGAAVADLRELLAPLVVALADDTARGRDDGAPGFAGRPAYDYAEETW